MAKEKKDTVITMRIKPSLLALIDEAAKVLGKTRSAFLLETAIAGANEVLAQPKRMGEKDWTEVLGDHIDRVGGIGKR